jgi:hypothetical protein
VSEYIPYRRYYQFPIFPAAKRNSTSCIASDDVIPIAGQGGDVAVVRDQAEGERVE